MGFFRTVVFMVIGYIAMKTLKRALKNFEAEQVKAKVNEQRPQERMQSLRLDPVTGAYIPEA